MAASCPIRVSVNGTPYEVVVEARILLADWLRDRLGLTGIHVGCEHGVCGSCTVLVNGEPVRSCLMLAVQAHETDVTTVEGLMPDGQEMSPLQEAFRAYHGLQCGYCTPGMLITARWLLGHRCDVGERELREALAGNLCRCTGYESIVDAVLAVARGYDGGGRSRSAGADGMERSP